MLGNLVVLVLLAVAWYLAFTKISKYGEHKTLRLVLLGFLGLAFVAVAAATLGFCPGETARVKSAIPGL